MYGRKRRGSARRAAGRPEKGKPWEPDTRDMDLYAMICAGHTFRYAGIRYDLSPVRVHQIVGRIDKWLAPQLMDKIREIKAFHTKCLMNIFREAMDAWRRSRRDAESLTVAQIEAGKFPGTNKTKTRRGQTGGVQYLEAARNALRDIREIWGANAPLEIQHSGEVRVAGRDVTAARDELLERLSERQSKLLAVSEN